MQRTPRKTGSIHRRDAEDAKRKLMQKTKILTAPIQGSRLDQNAVQTESAFALTRMVLFNIRFFFASSASLR
jgi:hypothetical protein